MTKKEVRIQEGRRNRGMTTFAPNQFALDNHTARKGSHFEGGWDNLMSLVKENWDKKTPGFTDGCFEVPLPPAGFFAGVVDLRTVSPDSLNMSELHASFEARTGMEEEPMISVRCDAKHKAPALKVRVICYSHELLGKEATTGADFELVTILAEPFEEPAPMPPVTKGKFSAEDFAKSIIFWAQHAVAADPE